MTPTLPRHWREATSTSRPVFAAQNATSACWSADNLIGSPRMAGAKRGPTSLSSPASHPLLHDSHNVLRATTVMPVKVRNGGPVGAATGPLPRGRTYCFEVPVVAPIAFLAHLGSACSSVSGPGDPQNMHGIVFEYATALTHLGVDSHRADCAPLPQGIRGSLLGVHRSRRSCCRGAVVSRRARLEP